MKHLIEQAAQYLKGKIRNTPTELSPKLSKLLGQSVYLKLENLQVTGSFKPRGALFYLSTLSSEDKNRGVAACSAGNHGLGVAYAAKKQHIPCTVFVPASVDQAKYDQLIELGAQVEKSAFAGYDDMAEWGAREAKKRGLALIPAYNDERIMASNGGTLAVEVLDQVPEATHFVLPIGGGGLPAGFAWHAKEKNPNAHITVCQLAACPAFKLSLEQDKAFTYMPATETLAGGLEGGLGAQCFEVLKTRVDGVALIAEEELKEAVCWMLKHHQYLIEPSAAVVIAACLHGYIAPKGTTVIVLSGRNVGYSTLRDLLKATLS